VCGPPLPEKTLEKIRRIFLRHDPLRWRPADV
jgi:hypothetical protein